MKIELRNPFELRQHKLHRHLPEPDLTSPEWFSFVDALHAGGAEHLPAITITESGFVVDGWRRVLAARNWKWSQVHCNVRSEEDAALIIVESLFGQRDMSRGAKVYFSIPLFPEYAEAAEKRRLAGLRKGIKSNEKPLIFPVSSHSTDPGLRDWAERFGVNKDTIASAIQLRDLLHNSKSEHLADLLRRAGHKMKTADIEALQASLRAEFEPQLASGEKGIWFVRSAIAGRIVTEDNPRNDQAPLQLEFWTSHFNPLRTGFRAWNKLDEETQMRIERDWRATLADLPERLRQAAAEELLQEA